MKKKRQEQQVHRDHHRGVHVREGAGACGVRLRAPRITMVEEARADAAEIAAVLPCRRGGLPFHIGIDVGVDHGQAGRCRERQRYSWYRRHHADVRVTIVEVLREEAAAQPEQDHDHRHHRLGGLLLAQWPDVAFVQEVIANKTAVETIHPEDRRGYRAGRRGCEDHRFDKASSSA